MFNFLIKCVIVTVCVSFIISWVSVKGIKIIHLDIKDLHWKDSQFIR